MRFVQFIIQRVEVIFTAVAIPFAVRVREPVVHVPARIIVSLVIAIVSVPAEVSLIKVIAVPIG